MLKMVAGIARLLALALAIVAAFTALGSLDTALALFVLGLIAGTVTDDDRVVRMLLLVLVLPAVATGLGTIPQIGTHLGSIATNIQMAITGSVTTVIVMRIYALVMSDLKGFGGAG